MAGAVPLENRPPLAALAGEFCATGAWLDRAAIGLGGVFLHLRAELNFYRLFNEAIENFSLAQVGARQAGALEKAGLPPPDA